MDVPGNLGDGKMAEGGSREMTALAGLLDELGDYARIPFEQARTLPSRAYTSPEFLALEADRIFSREWICVGRADALKHPGDHVTYEIAAAPIFVVRDRAGEIRAFSNVCRHRQSCLLEGTGNSAVVICPYHGWSYGLDGRLLGAPHMEQSPEFRPQDYRLPELRCELWEGWVYVTTNPAAEPIRARLESLHRDVVGRYRMADYVETFREEHVWNTNWKILAENFMESYHLPRLHRQTVGAHSKVEDMVCPPGAPAYNYHWITKEASLPIGNAHPANTHLEGDWRRRTALVTIYPSHLITLTPGYFWYLVVRPEAVNRVHLIFAGGLSPEFVRDARGAEYMAQLKTLLDAVNEEDRRCVESVFRGMSSPFASGGHLSYLERPNHEFGRYVAETVLAASPELRITG